MLKNVVTAVIAWYKIEEKRKVTVAFEMSLVASVLVLLVANVFIQAHGNPVTPQPNGLKEEGSQGNARFKRTNDLLKKYLSGPTKKPGWWHYETCMGQPCSLKRI
uniref:LRRNT_2 domain-containing protein n=1 Tax=Haemonchus contortus TaxID=6289 RepID=A0A7I4YVM5_HAECO